MNNKISPFLKLALVAGLLFLYIPLFILVIYSFNDSKLVTVWGGFSTKWYGRLLQDQQILSAAWLSLKIAVCASFAAVTLGTMAGYAMARIKRFRGSTLFAGLISAPMVMPDVITGLSMLLLIIQVQTMLQGWLHSDVTWLDRGFFTIFLGHTTLCMALAPGGAGPIAGRGGDGFGRAPDENLFCDYLAADCACYCFGLFARRYAVAG